MDHTVGHVLNSYDFTKPIDLANKGVYKFPRIVSQKEAVQKSIQYMKDTAEGKIEFLTTKYSKLNKAVDGGFLWDSTLVISGLSSAGKSTLSNRIISSFCTNSKKKIVTIKFNFEMSAHYVIAREICTLANIKISDLYNKGKRMGNQRINELVKDYYSKIIDFPVVYVEEPLSYKEIKAFILHFWNQVCKKDDIGLIVEVDHSSIVKGEENDSMGAKVARLMDGLNECKKKIELQGGRSFYVVITQMNRNIKNIERLSNPSLHLPNTSDLYFSSELEFYADYMLITHSPYKINLTSYTNEKYPTWLGSADKTNNFETPFIYWSVLKNRNGELHDAIPMLSNLKHFDFEEVETQDFIDYWDKFKRESVCYRKLKTA